MQKVAADAGRCRTIGCTMGNQKQKGQSDISDSDWTIAPLSFPAREILFFLICSFYPFADHLCPLSTTI